MRLIGVITLRSRTETPLLTPSDYERILGVLGACAAAGSLSVLREAALESLASQFGYRDTAVHVGPTRGGMFQDVGALALGRANRLLPEYHEHYHRWDPLAQMVARRGVTAAGCTFVLDQTLPHLTGENRMFLDRHLYRGGFHAVLCTEGAGRAVNLGLAMFNEEEGAFGPRDVAVMQRIGLLLTRQAELLIRLPAAPGWAARLTPREAEVARLVERGCTNQQIAAALFITLDTAKKHVKAACVKAGAANRAGLAARVAGLGP